MVWNASQREIWLTRIFFSSSWLFIAFESGFCRMSNLTHSILCQYLDDCFSRQIHYFASTYKLTTYPMLIWVPRTQLRDNEIITKNFYPRKFSQCCKVSQRFALRVRLPLSTSTYCYFALAKAIFCKILGVWRSLIVQCLQFRWCHRATTYVIDDKSSWSICSVKVNILYLQSWLNYEKLNKL